MKLALNLILASGLIFTAMGQDAKVADAPNAAIKLDSAQKLEMYAKYKEIADLIIAKSNLKTQYDENVKKLDADQQKAQKALQASLDKLRAEGCAFDFDKMDCGLVKPAPAADVSKAAK